jgi:uncharacterized membrane protein
VDRYCRKCGREQVSAAAPADSGTGLSARGVSILCYVPWLGWIAAVAALVAERYRGDREVRFHAFQGLYLSVAWLLSHWVVGLWFGVLFRRGAWIGAVMEAFLLAVWVVMLVKTSRGERYSLPIVGELAERSL